MKKYSKWILMFSVLFISLNVSPYILVAQDIVDGNPGPDVDAPIDGGIILLVAAGIGYGVKKARDNRKRSTVHLI